MVHEFVENDGCGFIRGDIVSLEDFHTKVPSVVDCELHEMQESTIPRSSSIACCRNSRARESGIARSLAFRSTALRPSLSMPHPAFHVPRGFAPAGRYSIFSSYGSLSRKELK